MSTKERQAVGERAQRQLPAVHGVFAEADTRLFVVTAFGVVATVWPSKRETTGTDHDQERRERLPLLGKGAVLAHRLARPLAAQSDEKQRRWRAPSRWRIHLRHGGSGRQFGSCPCHLTCASPATLREMASKVCEGPRRRGRRGRRSRSRCASTTGPRSPALARSRRRRTPPRLSSRPRSSCCVRTCRPGRCGCSACAWPGSRTSSRTRAGARRLARPPPLDGSRQAPEPDVRFWRWPSWAD